MPDYNYHAIDRDGNPVTGETQAEDVEGAITQLQANGLTQIQLEPIIVASLSFRDAEQFASQLSELSLAGAPLAEGLRAAAAEATSRRLANAFNRVADRIQKGGSLEQAVDAQARGLPAHVGRLVKAAVASRQLGPVLLEMTDHARRLKRLWAGVVQVMVYPIALLTLALFLAAVAPKFVAEPLIRMIKDFELEIPPAFQQLQFLNSVVPWMVLCLFLFCFIVCPLVGLLIGPSWRQRFLAAIPLIGPLWTWSGVSELTRLMAILLEQRIPLVDSLQTAAEGANSATIRQIAARLAVDASQGATLSQAVARNRGLPATLLPLVAWGEFSDDLPAALRNASEMFLERARTRASLIRLILPPMMFLVVFMVLLYLVSVVMFPLVTLVNLITGLS